MWALWKSVFNTYFYYVIFKQYFLSDKMKTLPDLLNVTVQALEERLINKLIRPNMCVL